MMVRPGADEERSGRRGVRRWERRSKRGQQGSREVDAVREAPLVPSSGSLLYSRNRLRIGMFTDREITDVHKHWWSGIPRDWHKTRYAIMIAAIAISAARRGTFTSGAPALWLNRRGAKYLSKTMVGRKSRPRPSRSLASDFVAYHPFSPEKLGLPGGKGENCQCRVLRAAGKIRKERWRPDKNNQAIEAVRVLHPTQMQIPPSSTGSIRIGYQ